MSTKGDATVAAVHAHLAELDGAELYRFVLRGLGDAGAAQDVVQETFLRAWRAADRFDPEPASLRMWLFAIARNAMLDHARAARARPWQVNLVDPPTAQQAGGAVDDPSEQLVRSWVVRERCRAGPGRQRGRPACSQPPASPDSPAKPLARGVVERLLGDVGCHELTAAGRLGPPVTGERAEVVVRPRGGEGCSRTAS